MTVKKHHVVKFPHMRQLRLAPHHALHVTSWGEPERAPHDQSNGDRVCPSVHLSVQRTFTFRIYACSNLTQVCNISLVQSLCYSASAIVRVQYKPIYRERPGYSKDVIDSTLSQQKRDRPGYSRDVIDSTPSHQKRDKPGYSKDVIDSTLSQQKRQARLQQRRDRLTRRETGQATEKT